ncbi:MAG: CDP-alcohol phosphatidyltransferase family protein [Thermaurantiacus tibetensis]
MTVSPADPAPAAPPLPDPRAIDVPSNRFLLHPIAERLLPLALRLGIPANAVSLAGLGLGLLAAVCYHHWQDWRLVLAGWGLMLGWHVLDGLDGRIARATGTATALGRFIDGFADYGVFVLVHVALALSLPDPVAALALALAAGAAHALQSAFYEARRATFLRRLAGSFAVAPRVAAGGRVERLYNALESRLGHRATALDAALAAAGPAERQARLARWAAAALPTLRLARLLSANARTHAIALACLLGDPRLAWWWELLVLTALALLIAALLGRAEARAAVTSRRAVAAMPPAP